MTRPALDTRHRLDQAEGPALSSLRPWVESMARRVSIAVMGLAVFGCVVVRASEPDIQSALPTLGLFALLLVGGAVFVVASGILVVISRRRRRRRLEKILVAVFAGSVCGALWVLIVATVVNAARPGAMGSVVLGVGVVTALGAAMLLLRPDSLSEVAGLSAMTIGFHSLVLPIGALIAFLVGGAQWLPATSARPALTAVILGIRLAGDPRTVGLSVGGLLLGVFLVFIGDRVLRGRRSQERRSRPRSDLSRPP